MNRQFENLTLEQVADTMGESNQSVRADRRAEAEFILRQTKAVQDTAEHNKRYAVYMLWTVIIMLVALGINTTFQVLNYVKK